MFYYISDIHVEHKIDFDALPDVMPEEDFGAVVASVADFIFYSVKNNHNEDDYLLIAGDTCESTHVGKYFFGRLTEFWKPDHIIVVLGNHELWTADQAWTDEDVKIKNNLKDIVNAWQELFDELGIIFLQNKAYEIKEKNVIVVGGLGFTGNNEYFNACNGQYLRVLTTRHQDRIQSRIFDDVYRWAVLECEERNEKLIVLTHTPWSDWHGGNIEEEPLSFPVAYISGHTHKNTACRIEGVAGKKIFLADAQVGYQGKPYYGIKSMTF